MSYIEKEKLIKADIASIENRVRHAFNQGYDLGFKDGKERAKPQEQEPKTGKWISTETKGVRYAFWCRYKCSLCGGLSDHTNFCPNCGAKMESEDKE